MSKIKYKIDLNDQIIDEFNRNMSLIDWDNLTEYCANINAIYEKIDVKLISLFNQNFKYKRINENKPKIPSDIRKLIRLKRVVTLKYKKYSENYYLFCSKYLYKSINEKLRKLNQTSAKSDLRMKILLLKTKNQFVINLPNILNQFLILIIVYILYIRLIFQTIKIFLTTFVLI